MAGLIKPKQIQSDDPTLNRIQGSVADALLFLQRQNILLNGEFVTVDVGTTDTLINHGLGRPYQGFLVVDVNAGATIYTSPTVNNIKDKQAILRSSGSVTAKIYFF